VSEIVVSGHMCLDLLPDMGNVPLQQLPSPGRLFEVGGMAVSTGGSASNTGLALHRLGVDVRLMASVGDDLIGQTIISVIQGYSPALTETITVKAGTIGSYTVVLSPERTDRIFLHCPGTNSDFGAADVRIDLLHDAKIFHLGYPPLLPRLVRDDGEELYTIYRDVKATGIVTSLDMSLPDPAGATGGANWRRILERTLPHVDIFLPSLEEALFALRREDFDRMEIDAAYLDGMADELLAMGAVIVGFKLGEYGFYLKTSADDSQYARLSRLSPDVDGWAGKRLYQPAFEVEVVGTTGAGDAAYAAFLTAMLKGEPPEKAARWFCAVGACNVEAPDATSGVRSWEETGQRLERGWQLSEKRMRGF
jgi:sugar/nucleoside kinase (ribokinase family)